MRSRFPRPLPSQEHLRDYLYIIDGRIYWAKNRNSIIKVDQVAGGVDKRRNRTIVVDNVNYTAARIAYKYHYGVDPVSRVIHIDGDRENFEKENLKCQIL